MALKTEILVVPIFIATPDKINNHMSLFHEFFRKIKSPEKNI